MYNKTDIQAPKHIIATHVATVAIIPLPIAITRNPYISTHLLNNSAHLFNMCF